MSKKMLGNLMKQAQMMQEKMAKIQEEAARKTVEATAGGGMVTVTATGGMEIVSIRIEKDVVDPEDIEMLQDLVTAAVNEALKKAQEMMNEEMGKLTSGLGLPGGMPGGLGGLGGLF
jgi:nucleoid-associated protein EbfC